MTALGEGVAASPSERPVLTNPDDVYIAALGGQKFRSDILPQDFDAGYVAVCDLSFRAGDRRIPDLPTARDLAHRLNQGDLTLANVQLAAARLDGGNPGMLGRVVHGVGHLAAAVIAPLQDVHSAGYRELTAEARKLVRREYHVDWNGDNVAPFLWGLVIRGVADSGRPVLDESWQNLGRRYLRSYDRAFELVPSAVPLVLRGLRLDIADKHMGPRAAAARFARRM